MNLSYSAYWSHKAKYYNCETEVWSKQNSVQLGHDDNDELESSLDLSLPDPETNMDCEVAEDCIFSSDSNESELEHEDNPDDQQDCDGVELLNTDDSDPDSDSDVSVQSDEMNRQVIRFISLFLMKLQLFHKLSDSVITTILNFLKLLISFLAKLVPSSPIDELLKIMPRSLFLTRKCAQLKQSNHKQYAVCPQCNTLYDQSLTKMTTLDDHGVEVSIQCSYIRFPNHPHSSRRKKCGEYLMKKMKYTGNIYKFKPKRTYCYSGIKEGISLLMQKPGFWDLCNQWRSNFQLNSDVYRDIYDGQVWKDFLNYKDKPFLNNQHSLALMFNCDWFQPYDHTTYSVGALYLVVINLPRAIRYKIENIIFVGIIPGPNEPKGTLNTYLGPMVRELSEMWTGCWLGSNCNKKYVRAALICVSCDIPASRKVAGLVGHCAHKGCSRCLKSFPTENFGEKPDYSGFDVDNWPRRTCRLHKIKGYDHLIAPTASAQHSIEREFGVKYSILSELEYYETVRFLVVDPMHSLFLGIAKHTFSTWIETDILNKSHYSVIQSRVDELTVPPTLGRIPLKLGAGFSGLTADQWRNWVCVYSLYSLRGILPNSDWQCWWLFVQACTLFCKRSITLSEANQAHKFLVEFCNTFEQQYGKKHVVVNMHLSCHLIECIKDYGPLYGFWCFGFERFNGVLGSYPNNNKDVSVTMMKKVHDEIQLDLAAVDSEFQPFLSEMSTQKIVGSLRESISPPSWPVGGYTSSLLRPYTEYILPHSLLELLSSMYTILHGQELGTISQVCIRSTRLSFNSHILCSNLARTERGSVIAAHWGSSLSDEGRHVGMVQFYFEHNIVIKHQVTTQRVAFVRWFETHPDRNLLNSPLEVWCDSFLRDSPNSFVLVSKILYPVAFTKQKLETRFGNETVMLTFPLTYIN